MSVSEPNDEVTREVIFVHLKKVLGDLFEVPDEQITLEADLYNDLDIDSIDAIDLMVEIKEFTGKRLDPEVFKGIRSVNDVVTALHDNMNQ